MKNAEIYTEELIVSTQTRRGTGSTILSPVRMITQIFEKDGTLIAEHDPMPETYAAMDLVHFSQYCFDREIKPNIDTVIEWLNSIKS